MLQTRQSAAINALINLILNQIETAGRIGISQEHLYTRLTSIPGFLPCDLDVFLEVLEDKGKIARYGCLVTAR